MPLIKRSVGSVPATIYDELYFPSDDYFGTGKYSIFLRKDAFSIPKGFGFTFGNLDYDIAIMVSYDPKEYKRVVHFCLSKHSELKPTRMNGFLLPANLDRQAEHLLVMTFTDWKITGAKIDDLDMLELQEGMEV